MRFSSLQNMRSFKKRHISRAVIKFVNTLFVVIPFIVCWFLYYETRTMTVNSRQSSVILLILYVVVFYTFSSRLDGFRISIGRIRDLIFSQIAAVCVTDVLAYITIWMLSIHQPKLYPGLICFASQTGIISLFCLFAHRYFFKTNRPHRAAVVYDARQGMEELLSEYGLDKRFAIEASYAIEDIINTPEKLNDIEDVFFCGVHTHERNILLKYCIEHGIVASVIPRIGDAIMSSAKHLHMLHLPFLRISRYDPPMEYVITKRVFDIVVSGIALVVLSPLMAVIALAVRSDGGPVIYQQKRLTKDSRIFTIYKFRSMCVDAEKLSGAVLSTGENDPRITRTGRVIRACRLDELPQLWNIFIGDMSFVGPRPERPELAAAFEKEFPEFHLRLQTKAGLTGYAQVYGKYNTTPYDKTLMDLMYISKPSLLEDLSILLSTIRILFSKESTEGVDNKRQVLGYEPDRRKQ